MAPARPILLLFVLLVIAGCPRSDPVGAPTEPPWFQDVTAKVGLTHTHDCGPLPGDYFVPQIVGSGCAFFDYDGDGLLDIYLVHNGGPKGKTNQLFHQEKDGTFRDVSADSGLDVAGYGMGVAIGDVNNDGLPDVLVTEYCATRLFLNQGGGKFVEVTREAGLDNPLWATAAAFFDYDRDGWLDLVVVNYADYDPSVSCVTAGGRPDYCGPNMFPPMFAKLYRNCGADGQDKRGGPKSVRFEDVTVKAGLTAAKGKGLGVLCADFDGDGWPDIFAANDMAANNLWINQHDGTFKEEALKHGVAFTGTGGLAGNMGIAWGDIDGNGLPDLFVTHLVIERHTLWQQETRGMFADRTAAAGLTSVPRSTGWGTAFIDFDRDGWLDLVIANGGVRRSRDIARPKTFWEQYWERNQVFANAGQGKFRDISASNPALCAQPGMGRGIAVGDFDNDGAPDLLVTAIASPVQLLRNVAPAKGHWLAVRAFLPKYNRDAYGAEVTLRAGGKSYFRLLNPGYSFLTSNDPRGHFGLGPSSQYDGIDVLWPDGSAETFPGGQVDRLVELRQGTGTRRPEADKR
jgi:hypothetical protein